MTAIAERLVPAGLASWLEAADPGAVRRQRGARAALAAVSTWLSLRLLLEIALGRHLPAASLFGVTACFVCALAVQDPRRADRAVTLLGAAIVFGAAATLAAAVATIDGVTPVVLLGLVFLSFAARRRGLRASELALLATMGFYFAGTGGVDLDRLPWFVVAAAIGVAWLGVWQLVLLPYDPGRSILAAGGAFSRHSGDLVAMVAGILRAATDPASAPPPERDLQRMRRQVRLSREVIENQFPGALAPRGWTQDRLQRMRVTLYDAELDLGQLVDACADPDALAAIPADLARALLRTLDALSVALRDTTATEAMQALRQETSDLEERVRTLAQRAVEHGTIVDATSRPWVSAALRLSGGARQVARSIEQARSLLDGRAGQTPSGIEVTWSPRTPRTPPSRPAPPAASLRSVGGLRIHPTTALGIQAVIAVGAAMLVGRLAGIDHVNWTFWTAFVVIAGSVGESLRRMLLRVLGTVAGVVLGVGLAVALPDELALVVLVATAAVFLTIYCAPISYALMVFWLNLGFVIVYAQLGASELDLLVDRPLATLLGALVAAVVVVTVLPSRLTARYRQAVVRFLSAIEGAVSSWATPDPGGSEDRAAAGALVDDAWRRIEQTLPSMTFESNPLIAARSPLTEQGTRLGALAAAVTRLGQAAQATDEAAGPGGDAIVTALAQRIRQNTRALMGAIGGSGGTVVATLADILGPEASAAALATLAAGDPGGDLELVVATGIVAPEVPAGHEPRLAASLVEVHGRLVGVARGLGATVE